MSPVIPTVASLLLAALWGLSVFAGWGLEAFCSDGESSRACADRLGMVSTVSSVFAIAAAVATVTAWFSRQSTLLGLAVAAWVAAEGVLFIGGVFVQ
ncbi:hypothetical protein J5X84_22910 [Streptosporangiaceae bacterium NEAU-GS5]|nr:hypothetical protein [Streptosporangiaceae bacterium NEAU-GS5]